MPTAVQEAVREVAREATGEAVGEAAGRARDNAAGAARGQRALTSTARESQTVTSVTSSPSAGPHPLSLHPLHPLPPHPAQGLTHFRLMGSPDLIARTIAEVAVYAAAKACGLEATAALDARDH